MPLKQIFTATEGKLCSPRHWPYPLMSLLYRLPDGPAALPCTCCAPLQAMYRRRAKVAVEGAQEYLTGIAQWSNPAAGMFMWVKLTGKEWSNPAAGMFMWVKLTGKEWSNPAASTFLWGEADR